MPSSLSFLNNESFQMYNRNVAKHCKSINAAIILSELINRYEYHFDRDELTSHEKYGEGWFYFTIDKCEERTCLTRREQDTALKILKSEGLIEWSVFGLPAKRYFKVNEEKILAIFGLSKNLSSMSKTNKLVYTKQTNRTQEPIHIKETYEETLKKKILTPPSHSVSQEAKDCVCFFSSFFEKEGIHITDLQRKHWTKDFTAMHEVDKIPWDEIKKIIEYAHLDDFWQSRTLTAKNLRKNATTIRLQMKQAKKAPNEDHGFENGKIYGKYVCEIDDKEIHFRNLENGTFEYLLFSDKDFVKNLKGLCKRLKIPLKST